MFTGDNVLGHGTAMFEDLATYLASLKAMEEEFDGRIYPAHGDVVEEGRVKVREYITHRKQREEEVLEVLGDGEARTGMEIVKIVYRNVPVELHGPAEGGVQQVLRKLRGEGRVVERTPGKWTILEKATL